jgi:hypothetical protein
MNRYVITATLVALSFVAVGIGLVLRDGTGQALASPAPKLQDGRQFGLIKSVDQISPGTIVFDPAEQLTGGEANRAAAAHGDEVPVPNDVYKVNDDLTVHTLALSPDVEISVINYEGDCCDPVATDLEGLEASGLNGWGYWVTLEDGVVVRIDEQYHP